MKILKTIILLLIVTTIVTGIGNIVLNGIERDKIIPYGTKIKLKSGNINICDKGPKDGKVIVLLPGYGTISPILDYSPLIEDLSKDFRVIAIEPFGYGDSDRTAVPRTIENIAEEIHSVIETLGIKNYILCGHSIAGIYSIYYLNKYPGEAVGFVGLDTSVPKQMSYDNSNFFGSLRKLAKDLGYIRVARFLYPQGFMATNDYYSNDIKKQIAYRVNRDFANPNNLDEGYNFERSWDVVKDMCYPKNLKCIFFLNSYDKETDSWRYIETKNSFDESVGKIYFLQGGHYIHRDNFEFISKTVREQFGNR